MTALKTKLRFHIETYPIILTVSDDALQGLLADYPKLARGEIMYTPQFRAIPINRADGVSLKTMLTNDLAVKTTYSEEFTFPITIPKLALSNDNFIGAAATNSSMQVNFERQVLKSRLSSSYRPVFTSAGISIVRPIDSTYSLKPFMAISNGVATAPLIIRNQVRESFRDSTSNVSSLILSYVFADPLISNAEAAILAFAPGVSAAPPVHTPALASSSTIAFAPDATAGGNQEVTTSLTTGTGSVFSAFASSLTWGAGQLYFVPSTDISNVELLLDAGDITGYSDNDTLTTWADSGPNGLDATIDAGTPKYRTNIVGTEPIVRFDGSSAMHAGATTDWGFLSNGTDSSFFGVIFINGSNPNNLQVIITTINDSTTPGYSIYYDDRGSSSINNRLGCNITTGAAYVVVFGDNDGSWVPNQFAVITVTQEDGRTGDDFRGYYNGTEVESDEHATSFNANDPTYELHIGRRPGGNFPINGDIGFMLITSDRKSDTDKAQIEEYLKIRYAITSEPTHQATPLTPAPGSTGISVNTTLTWSDESSNGATKYYLQVGTASDFLSGLVFDGEVVTNSKDMTGLLSSSTQYFWRVKSRDTVWESDYHSPGFSFTTS